MKQGLLLFGLLLLTATSQANEQEPDTLTEELPSRCTWEVFGKVWVKKCMTLPQWCATLYPSNPDRYWDEERDVYLPINVEWEECMGVGRK